MPAACSAWSLLRTHPVAVPLDAPWAWLRGLRELDSEDPAAEELRSVVVVQENQGDIGVITVCVC